MTHDKTNNKPQIICNSLTKIDYTGQKKHKVYHGRNCDVIIRFVSEAEQLS